ncbi:MAG: orotidine-5'-phosphate decarboxylase [Candidatus Diapherotrites archaeon]|nr:orotidine-5'-phosphate decarboxylase [Candidatus Diapherotrites archaeon]
MNYSESLIQSAEKNKSLVCFGMDPVLEKLPFKTDSIEQDIVKFYSEIFQSFKDHEIFPACVKPNYAFFAQYGFPGLHALEKVITLAHELYFPVILDVKRGDIGSTAKAYVKECFDFWKADAVTLSPFMGYDSVQPFIERAEKDGKGLYILNRTSNAGAQDFQTQVIANNGFLFERIAQKVLDWGKNCKGNLGVVIGATSLQELENLSLFYSSAEVKPVPFLIPGVGTQGGSAKEVLQVLTNSRIDLRFVRINSSSELNYAWQKQNNPEEFALASMRALEKLNQEIDFK